MCQNFMPIISQQKTNKDSCTGALRLKIAANALQTTSVLSPLLVLEFPCLTLIACIEHLSDSFGLLKGKRVS